MAVSAWERRGGVAVEVLPRLQQRQGFQRLLNMLLFEFVPLYEQG